MSDEERLARRAGVVPEPLVCCDEHASGTVVTIMLDRPLPTVSFSSDMGRPADATSGRREIRSCTACRDWVIRRVQRLGARVIGFRTSQPRRNP